MRALLCPASLKGVLTAREAAAALGRGVRDAEADAVELPIADGGEGTADALRGALGGEWREAIVSDPLGRPVSTHWLLLDDGRAVIEAAAAIGLPLLTPEERDPLVASSRGLGELALAAFREEPRELLVGLGGSATVDGGAGVREVLRELPVRTIVLYDVRTTLADAARLFGPQKGASADGVAALERRLREESVSYAGPRGRGRGRSRAAFAALGAELVAGRRRPRPRRLRRATSRVRPGRDGLRSVDERRRGQGAGRRRAPRCCRRPVVVFGGRVVLELDGAETISLSGDPAAAEQDLEALGRRLAR